MTDEYALQTYQMQTFSGTTCTVVVDHAGAIQRFQHLFAENFVDLSICDMRSVNRANFATFAECEMDGWFRSPTLVENLTPPFCRTGKQMHLIVLDGLLPTNPIAALLPVEEHLPIRKDFIQRTKAVTPGLSPGLACCPAALVSCFMTFLTCQNIRPPYKCLVGCRLKCVVLTHEMRLGTFLTMQAASV